MGSDIPASYVNRIIEGWGVWPCRHWGGGTVCAVLLLRGGHGVDVQSSGHHWEGTVIPCVLVLELWARACLVSLLLSGLQWCFGGLESVVRERKEKGTHLLPLHVLLPCRCSL